MMILDMYHHMYLVELPQNLQVSCEAFSHPKIIVHYLCWNQSQDLLQYCVGYKAAEWITNKL